MWFQQVGSKLSSFASKGRCRKQLGFRADQMVKERRMRPSGDDHVPEMDGFILILLQTFWMVSIALLKAKRWSSMETERGKSSPLKASSQEIGQLRECRPTGTWLEVSPKPCSLELQASMRPCVTSTNQAPRLRS